MTCVCAACGSSCLLYISARLPPCAVHSVLLTCYFCCLRVYVCLSVWSAWVHVSLLFVSVKAVLCCPVPMVISLHLFAEFSISVALTLPHCLLSLHLRVVEWSLAHSFTCCSSFGLPSQPLWLCVGGAFNTYECGSLPCTWLCVREKVCVVECVDLERRAAVKRCTLRVRSSVYCTYYDGWLCCVYF